MENPFLEKFKDFIQQNDVLIDELSSQEAMEVFKYMTDLSWFIMGKSAIYEFSQTISGSMEKSYPRKLNNSEKED